MVEVGGGGFTVHVVRRRGQRTSVFSRKILSSYVRYRKLTNFYFQMLESGCTFSYFSSEKSVCDICGICPIKFHLGLESPYSIEDDHTGLSLVSL